MRELNRLKPNQLTKLKILPHHSIKIKDGNHTKSALFTVLFSKFKISGFLSKLVMGNL